MTPELKQAVDRSEEITLEGNQLGPDVPVRINYQTGYREDEYGEDVADRLIHVVRSREAVGRIQVGGHTFEVLAGKEIPVKLFEEYEAENDRAMSGV